MHSHEPSSLSIVTFNLLAPCYKRLFNSAGKELPDREAHHPQLWTKRLDALLDLLHNLTPQPHIIALQEFWFNDEYIQRFRAKLADEYHVFVAKRPGQKEDGLATLVHRDSPVFLSEPKHVATFPLADADRVGLAVAVTLSSGDNLLVVNAHLTFPHGFISRFLRSEQAATLASFVSDYVSEKKGSVHSLVVGDFNGDGNSRACKRLFQNGFVNCYDEVNIGLPKPATHFNHKKEEVFVDHVFLKSVQDELCHWRRRPCSLREVADNRDKGESRRPRKSPSQPLRALSRSPVRVREPSGDSERDHVSVMQPVSTIVYPEELGSEGWPANFDLSDHRPVGIQFEYGVGAS